MAYRLLVTGRAACFRRREFVSDEVSYDVMTPAAGRKLFEAVYWAPTIWWRVESITVLRPIRSIADAVVAGRAVRSSLVDVAYLVTGRFEAEGDSGRHAAMFKRRAKAGRYFRPPSLGGVDWPADIRLVDNEERFESPCSGVTDLGWMLFDRDRHDRDRLRYFRATMRDGVIDLTDIDVATLPS